ncbi:MAG: hypothetical protein RRA32_07485 [bacterium]|nr:hypothetical protein [bacterium]
MTPDERTRHLFDLLDRLGELGAEELLGYFTEENVNALTSITGLLKDRLEVDRYLTRKLFVQIVGELYDLKWMWSRKLGETLNNAGDAYVKGEKVQAMWILDGFIRFCSSPHYRSIAEKVLERYGEG